MWVRKKRVQNIWANIAGNSRREVAREGKETWRLRDEKGGSFSVLRGGGGKGGGV